MTNDDPYKGLDDKDAFGSPYQDRIDAAMANQACTDDLAGIHNELADQIFLRACAAVQADPHIQALYAAARLLPD